MVSFMGLIPTLYSMVVYCLAFNKKRVVVTNVLELA